LLLKHFGPSTWECIKIGFSYLISNWSLSITGRLMRKLLDDSSSDEQNLNNLFAVLIYSKEILE
jgi:hypothetical protein